MKIINLIFLIAMGVFFQRLFAEDVRFLFIAPTAETPESAPIIKGLHDGAKEYLRTSKQGYSLQTVYAANNEECVDVLKRAYLEGFKNIAILPAQKPDSNLCSQIANLAKQNLNIILLGKFAESTDAKLLIKDDYTQLGKKLSEAVKPFENAVGLSTLVFKSTDYPYALDEKVSQDLLSNFKNCVQNDIVLYSLYEAQNKTHLQRLDNYVLLFLSPAPIANAKHFMPSRNRLFAICLGASPQTAVLLKKSQLDMCVSPDYYGYGYIAARELIYADIGKSAAQKEFLLPLKIYTKKNADEYKNEWGKFIQEDSSL